MKRLRVSLFIVSSMFFCLLGQSASALETSPYTAPPKLVDSPVIITGYSLAAGKPEYIQLFNSSTQPIHLEGWKLQYAVSEQTEPITLNVLGGWIAPSNYLLATGGSVIGADFSYGLTITGSVTPSLLRLAPPIASGFAVHDVALSKQGTFQRKISATTGNYLSTFETTASPTLYGGGFYTYQQTTPLQFSEILAHPRTCSPVDPARDCGDYVKIYNPSTSPVDLSAFRLRVGYKGQSATSSNSYLLNGIVQPGHFVLVSEGIDGQSISVTNGGGFIWLEDSYGITRYDSTVQSYEDASADSKKGQAWAYDANNATWKWTTQPTPSDTPSVFPVSLPDVTTSVKAYTPCRENQYRSEETHRCRSLATLTVASVLKSCPVGQYRNAATNRCRKLASTVNSPKPCAAGQERNAETNRCRKTTSDIPKSAFSVTPVAETGKAFAGWWALGGVGTLAAGYGVWEWRREVATGIRKIGTFFTSGK